MGERRVTGSTRTVDEDELSDESTGSIHDGAEQPRSGAASLRADAQTARENEATGSAVRGTADVVTVENWTPPSVGRAAGTIREYLSAAESLEFADAATHVDGSVTPAAVGITTDRLLVVSNERFVGLGLDRVCAVRSDHRTDYGIRGSDYRLVIAVGFLVATIGFVGVLGASTTALTPTAALATLGGAIAVDHVRRTGVDLDPLVAVIRRGDRDSGARLHRAKRRVNGTASDDDLALAAAGALALIPFALVVAFEGGVAVPSFTLLVVAGVGLSLYAFRHRDAFDGIEVVRRHRQTVRVTTDDGDVIVVRTHPESTLDRELSGLAQRTADAA